MTEEALRRRAKELAADEGFRAILKRLKERAIREWANTSSADEKRREELYRDIQAVGRLENDLLALMSDAAIDARKADKAARK